MRELEGKCVLYGLKHCAWTPSEATCDEWVSDESEVDDETDLIRRKDALKPFCTAPDGTRIPEIDCDNFPVEFSVEFIKKHLLSLPSAEATGALDDAIAKYVADGLMELPSAEAEWIPCSERLPSEDGRYLVTYPLLRWQNNWISVMHYGKPLDPTQDVKGRCFYYSDSEWGDAVYDNILAWMPLPMPYKGGDDE